MNNNLYGTRTIMLSKRLVNVSEKREFNFVLYSK